jgi:glutamyl-tRNA reductase
VQRYRVVTITHKTAKVNRLKDYLIADSDEDVADYPAKRLKELKNAFEIDELLYLNTCNRVTFFFTSDRVIDNKFLKDLFLFINPNFNKELINLHLSKAMVFEKEDAVKHFMGVAASFDSLVIGEREILGQIKSAYMNAKKHGLCGDDIRLAFQQAIVFAKKIHCDTRIGEKPVSVVSLAFRTLLERNITKDAKVMIIGAGQTNHLMTNLLNKYGIHNVTVYNRTLSKAEDLAARFENGKAIEFDKLINHSEDVDIILTCTGANYVVLTKEIFERIAPKGKKAIIVDLAVPQDVAQEIIESENVDYIDVASLEKKAQENMRFRRGELYKAEAMLEEFLVSFSDLYKERRLELALAHIPNEVKDIRERALNGAFRKDIESLDVQSKEVLEKVMQYMEEKYIALPFKASKKSLLNKKFRP